MFTEQSIISYLYSYCSIDFERESIKIRNVDFVLLIMCCHSLIHVQSAGAIYFTKYSISVQKLHCGCCNDLSM